jgi:hypothetical protein
VASREKADEGAVDDLVDAVRAVVVRLGMEAVADGVVEEEDAFALIGREVKVTLEGVCSITSF